MEQSLRIVEQALDRIPEGDVHAAVPRRIRPNAGDVYVRSESPRGEIGFYVVSDGSATPFRVKARAPAFVNLSICPEICRGYMIADIVAIVGSVDIVLGEVDR
jgi:NADH-quinone oxidoreductase subunit D